MKQLATYFGYFVATIIAMIGPFFLLFGAAHLLPSRPVPEASANQTVEAPAAAPRIIGVIAQDTPISADEQPLNHLMKLKRSGASDLQLILAGLEFMFEGKLQMAEQELQVTKVLRTGKYTSRVQAFKATPDGRKEEMIFWVTTDDIIKTAIQ